MKRLWLLYLLIVSVPAFAGCSIIRAEPSPSPQVGTLSGVITGPSGPVPGASVRVTPQDNSYHVGQSDSQGYYSLSAIPAGTVTLEVSAPGYMTYNNPNVAIPNMGTVTVNVSLTPS